MKTINETFTDEEFELLQKKKGEKNWHDFIILLTKIPIFEDLPDKGDEE